MNRIYLYDIKNKNIIEYDKKEVIDALYYGKAKVPDTAQIKKSTKNIKINIDSIKLHISKIDDQIPLYDIYLDNLILVDKFNVYYRVTYNNYRFPDKAFITYVKQKIDKLSSKKLTDVLTIRKLRKYMLIIEFFNNFDMDELFNTYIRVFYLYANEVGRNITLCTRPSFMNHFKHIKPFYSRIEVLNMALNMDIKLDKIYYDQEKINELCSIVQVNDINSSVLLTHQEYIVKNNKVGLLQYYTIHGSYYVNKYLRNMASYKNSFLENFITSFDDIMVNAPAFDKEYYVYRFTNSDSFISDSKIGDIFTDDGYMSTTRDPFYNSSSYSFGFILFKIKIPKQKKGVALCVETLSLFPFEQEIIFDRGSMFKIVSKDHDCNYHHTDKNIVSKIKTRYELEYVGNKKNKFENYTQPSEPVHVDFVEINSSKEHVNTLDEKIDVFKNKYANQNNQIVATVGKNKYTIIMDEFDSTGSYKPFYRLNTNKGYSFYSFYSNYMLFFIEMGYDSTTNSNMMFVNFFYKYSTIDPEKLYTPDDFLMFLSSIGLYFDITKIIIYSDCISCDTLKITHAIKNSINSTDNNIDTVETDINKLELDMFGGSISLDIYNYLQNKKKKYNGDYVYPRFSYIDIDKLYTLSPDMLLNKLDQDELYQIYSKIYDGDKNIKDFIIWIYTNKCYLVNTLIDKMFRIYTIKNNPFILDYYVLDPLLYLYNKNIIWEFPDIVTIDKDYSRSYIMERNMFDRRK